MKKFLEKAFNISLLMGVLASVVCLLSVSLNNPHYIIIALSIGLFGFVLSCFHIVAVQRYGVKQAPVSLLLLSLFLNSIPLIYMMVVVLRAKH